VDFDAVSVRAASPADAPAIASIYRSVVLDSSASFEESPPDADEVGRRMLARPRLPWLIAEHDDRVAGYAYASQHRQRASYRWSVDCSVYLDPEHRGRGVGRALYERLIPMVADLGYVSLFAGIALPNDASVGLHEALGFTAIGAFPHVGFKHGSWLDVGWWQRTLRDLPPAPEEPREWRPPARDETLRRGHRRPR
jgi:L-amino acid N-acyltransferase YncA